MFIQHTEPQSKAILSPNVRSVIHHEPGRMMVDEAAVPSSPSGFLYDYRDEIVKLDEYKKLIDSLEHTPETAKLKGNFVGTSAGAILVDWQYFPTQFIDEYWLQNRSLEYNPAVFAEVYSTLEGFINNDEVIRVITLPFTISILMQIAWTF